MTYDEAIEYLKILKLAESDDSVGMLKKETYDMAIEALEKQIPKKPMGEKYKLIEGFGNCPNCNNFIDDMRSYRVCSRCGQAIDWSETE